jgi:hypothetical protein
MKYKSRQEKITVGTYNPLAGEGRILLKFITIATGVRQLEKPEKFGVLHGIDKHWIRGTHTARSVSLNWVLRVEWNRLRVIYCRYKNNYGYRLLE